MNEKQAIEFATENFVVVRENRRDKCFEWIKLIKGDSVVTVQRPLNERGKCWGVYGPLVPRANYNHDEFEFMRLGAAIERGVEVLLGWYS